MTTRSLFSLVLISFLVVGCGSDEEVPATPNANTPTTPAPAGGTGKWTAAEVDTQSKSCAQGFEDLGYARGSYGNYLSDITQSRLTNNQSVNLTYNQWYSFCQCFYVEIATTYTFAEFSASSSSIVENVWYNTDAPTRCYKAAGGT